MRARARSERPATDGSQTTRHGWHDVARMERSAMAGVRTVDAMRRARALLGQERTTGHGWPGWASRKKKKPFNMASSRRAPVHGRAGWGQAKSNASRHGWRIPNTLLLAPWMAGTEYTNTHLLTTFIAVQASTGRDPGLRCASSRLRWLRQRIEQVIVALAHVLVKPGRGTRFGRLQ